MLNRPIHFLFALVSLTLPSYVSADPADSFPNVTHAPPLHELAKRDENYAVLNVQWPDKTLMYSEVDNKHWWSDEPWASGWYYTPGHSANILGQVAVFYYEGGYDWKRNHATAQANCTGGYTSPAPAGKTAMFTMGTASPYITGTATTSAYFTCWPAASATAT